MFKKFTDAEKTTMNKKALAIVKGHLLCAFFVGSFFGALPGSAKADEIGDYTGFKSSNTNVSSLEARNKEWAKLGDYFESRTKAQYGASQFGHFCEDELKVCTNYNYYRTNGHFMFLRETVALENQDVILNREICMVNDQGNVRDCSNFDTDAKHRDTKDVRGVWRTVSGRIR